MVYNTFIYKKDIRELEEQADQCGLSYQTLMENAGTRAADVLISTDVVNQASTILILCGTGNNGGDGYKMASCFASRFPGNPITVIAVGGDPQTEIARIMRDQASAFPNVRIYSTDDFDEIVWPAYDTKSLVLIDAIYGIGFHGELSSEVKHVFRIVRTFQKPTVVAIDIPSGMYADEEAYDPDMLKAAHTLTFTDHKKCMLSERCLNMCGAVTVCDVGIPSDMVDRYRVQVSPLLREQVSEGLVPRQAFSHKGTYGSVYALCGSYGMAGAAMLSGKAALRMGVGLLHYFLPESIYPIVAGQLWEAVYHPVEETQDGGLAFSLIRPIVETVNASRKKAFLCGPGLSANKHTAAMIRKLLPQIRTTQILDADGLNAFVGHIDEWKAMSDSGISLVLTPHPAEAARLLDCSVEEVERDRIAAAKKLCEKSGATVVLKGTRTLIMDPSLRVCVNTTACSGLAKGGSGDVLAGMIASLIAQGSAPYQACVTAVYLHGLASVQAAQRLSETGMLPTDLLEELARLLSQFETRG